MSIGGMSDLEFVETYMDPPDRAIYSALFMRAYPYGYAIMPMRELSWRANVGEGYVCASLNYFQAIGAIDITHRPGNPHLYYVPCAHVVEMSA